MTARPVPLPCGPTPDPARVVIVRLTPAQATALHDVACWAIDDDPDQDRGELVAYLEPDRDVLKAAAAAIIDAGGSGHAYL